MFVAVLFLDVEGAVVLVDGYVVVEVFRGTLVVDVPVVVRVRLVVGVVLLVGEVVVRPDVLE